MPLKQFVDSHCHSYYSTLDGVSSPTDNVLRAKALGMPAVAISDHGTISGLYEHYQACKSEKVGGRAIVPLIGNELYWKERLQDGDKDRKYFHGIFLAANEQGFKNLLKLSSIGFKPDHYEFSRPVVSLEEILRYSEGLVFTTGCMIGLIGAAQRRQLSYEESEKLFGRLHEAFKGRFFVELGPAQVCMDWRKISEDSKEYGFVERSFKDAEGENGFTRWTNCLQIEHNLRAIRLAHQFKAPLIIASDAHMADPSLKPVQDMLISGASNNRFHFHQTHAMLSSDEVWAMMQQNHSYVDLKSFEEMIDNTHLLVDVCKDLKLKFPTLNPKFHLDKHPLWRQGMTAKDLMFAIVQANSRMPDDQVYRDRLKEEIRVICDNGSCDYTDYFLILADIVRAAKERDVGVGPARGSAGGCLLSYLLGVTAIDPIKWNLNFTRFLNEGRLKAGSPPDIDLDFSNRDKVVDYVFNTYGEEYVAMVGSYLNIKSKNALKDIARWKAGGHLDDSDPVHKITATIKPAPATYPSEKDWLHGFMDSDHHFHPGFLETNKLLKDYLTQNPDIKDMFFKILEKPRSQGKHAGGIVITPIPIDEVIPTRYFEGRKCTQVNFSILEKMGGMKIDLLGVNTLNWIYDTVKLVRDRAGVMIDPWNLPEEEEVFKPTWDGRAETIFQFDTSLVVPFMRRIRPRKIHDLILITSICRPGGLDSKLEDGATVAEHFVNRYNSKEPVVYVDPIVEPILQDTYGLVVFQEQIQKIFEVVGGFSSVESDDARRAIGKKKLDLINSLKEKYADNAYKLHGWNKCVCPKEIRDSRVCQCGSKSENLWNSFIGAANYSFNRAHACAYGIIAYACAWLKYHYPLEWWCSVLSNSQVDDIKRYLAIVHDLVRLPHVNAAATTWEIHDSKLVAPMGMVKGVGPKAIASLQEESKKGAFHSFDEFYQRAQGRAVHKGVVTALAIAGCFDGLPLAPGGDPVSNPILFVMRLHEFREEKLPASWATMTRAAILRRKMELLPIYACNLGDEFIEVLEKQTGFERRAKLILLEGRPLLLDYSKFANASTVSVKEFAIVGMVTEAKRFYFTPRSGRDAGKRVGALRVTIVNDGRLAEFVLWPSMLRDLEASRLIEGAVILAYGELKWSSFKNEVAFNLNSFKLLPV